MSADLNTYASRAVLNFAHRCALNCEWCYVPFGSTRAERHILIAIVDRIASLGFETITFGGGDPFQYPYIGELAERAKAASLTVHIDTHGKSLSQSTRNSRLINDSIDLIGLPLDGPSADVHDGMRNASGHFEIVMRRLWWLNSIGANYKINTVVSRQNIDSLAELATHVSALTPSRWSIYQYMALGPGARVSPAHSLQLEEFESAVSQVMDNLGARPRFLIEASDSDSRRLTYPIVHHDGSVFVHAKEQIDALQHVCSIFDPEARQMIDALCGPERTAAVTRYGTKE